MPKITPFLRYDDQLEQALELYASIVPDTIVHDVKRAGPEGTVQSAEFTVGGQRVMAYNGGSHFSFNDGVSLFVDCKDQDEVDAYWDKLLAAGGKEQQCGWIIDPVGLRWQIIPRQLMELMNGHDAEKASAVRDAMLKMAKIDVAALKAAHRDA